MSDYFYFFRVRFPDGWILQGTFSVHEAVSAVSEFVTSSLETPLPYVLADSVTGLKLGTASEDSENSLLDLGATSYKKIFINLVL